MNKKAAELNIRMQNINVKARLYLNVKRLALHYHVKISVHFILMFCITTVAIGQVATPQLLPVGNSISPVSHSVLVTCATVGAEMRYTLDASEPDYFDTPVPANGNVLIPRSVTLKVKAWVGASESLVATGNFEVVGDIAAGGYHSLAVKSNRTSAAWGNPANGRLANGTITTAQPLPLPANRSASISFSTATSVAAGLNHSLFLHSDQSISGGVFSCGLNTGYQLGSGTAPVPDNLYPRQVITDAGIPLTGAIQVAAADTYSAALLADGKVMTWGTDVSSRLGRLITSNNNRVAGIVTTSSSPSAHLTNINQVSAGKTHVLARQGGQVYVWGLNSSGQLGTGNNNIVNYATLNSLLTNVTDISAGEAHSAVVRWDSGNQGTVFCFGQQLYGRLGNKLLSSAIVNTPQQVFKSGGGNVPLTDIVEVACGPSHTLALDSSNRVWAWGSNFDGELGDNSALNVHRAEASLVKDPSGTGNLENIARIVAGGIAGSGFSLAIAKDGRVYAWGANSHGQLGCGDTTLRRLPCEVPNLRLTNKIPPSLFGYFTNVLVDSTPGSVTLRASFIDTDGFYDIDYVVFGVDGQEIKVDNNIMNSAVNNYPAPLVQLQNLEFEATFTGLGSGPKYSWATAYDRSGMASTFPQNFGQFSIKQSVSVSSLVPSLNEGHSAPTFRVSRVTDGYFGHYPLTVNLSVSGTATSGIDFTALPTSVDIPQGATYTDITLDCLNDSELERGETLVLNISSGLNYGIANSSATTLLVDKDDVDNDGMLDSLELNLFGNLSQGEFDDYDGDGIPNTEELQFGNSPTVNETVNYSYDSTGRLLNAIGLDSFSTTYDSEGNIMTAQ